MGNSFTTTQATGGGTFDDTVFIKLNLPDNVSFEKNGVTLSLDDVITSVLNMTSVNGSKEAALAELFAMLETDQYKSERIGEYSYTRWGMKGSDYWRTQAIAVRVQANGSAPNVIMRPRNYGRRWCP